VKNASLSLRLGLSVTLMGAALVLLLACLAVFALDHELDSRARKDLARKMMQVEHNCGSTCAAKTSAAVPIHCSTW